MNHKQHLINPHHHQLKTPTDLNNNNSHNSYNRLTTPCIDHEQSATSLFSIISEAKPAEIIVNDCGEVELQMTKENHKYYMAYELIFRMNNRPETTSSYSSVNEYSLADNQRDYADNLCCFAETKNGSLLLATDQGNYS